MNSQIINYWVIISDFITFPENIKINKEFKTVSLNRGWDRWDRTIKTLKRKWGGGGNPISEIARKKSKDIERKL